MGSLGDKTAYNAYYGDFRGVDFSSDHTQVNRQRLAYAVNMYRDYQSGGQSHALETIPGFRRRVQLPDAPAIYGIHKLNVRDGAGQKTKILIHAGNKIYEWHNYPLSINVEFSEIVYLPEEKETISGIKIFEIKLSDTVFAVRSLNFTSGEAVVDYSYNSESRVLTVNSSELLEGDRLNLTYVEGEATEPLFVGAEQRRSTSFIFNNRLYFVDGKNYLVYDGNVVRSAPDNAYVPTTYINIIPSGENADIGTQYEQRNILQPKFKHTFIADGESTEFYMNEHKLDEVCEVRLYGELVTNYTVDLEKGKITFDTAPGKPEDNGYTEFFAGLEITAKNFRGYFY